jgi:hypothetical protein
MEVLLISSNNKKYTSKNGGLKILLYNNIIMNLLEKRDQLKEERETYIMEL